jgi:flagellar biosynthesis protein FliQ
MTAQTILDLGAKTIWVTLQISAPALLAAVITGLAVSIFQAATQINEQTLTFIPKILLMTVALVLCGSWIMQTMIGFTVELINNIPAVIR